MNYVTVHRDGKLVACIQASSDDLVKLQRPSKKGERVVLTVLRPPRIEPEPA